MIEDWDVRVAQALRGIRPAAYRLEGTGDDVRLTLVMRASPNGRRNAADRIVAALGARGLGVAVSADSDAVRWLAEHVEPVRIIELPAPAE